VTAPSERERHSRSISGPRSLPMASSSRTPARSGSGQSATRRGAAPNGGERAFHPLVKARLALPVREGGRRRVQDQGRGTRRPSRHSLPAMSRACLTGVRPSAFCAAWSARCALRSRHFALRLRFSPRSSSAISWLLHRETRTTIHSSGPPPSPCRSTPSPPGGWRPASAIRLRPDAAGPPSAGCPARWARAGRGRTRPPCGRGRHGSARPVQGSRPSGRA
jgi:hypothetical protein